MALKNERTEHSNRIKGLLVNIGLDISVDEHLPKRLEELRQWDGKPVATELRDCILREFERWKLVDRQVHDRENAQRRAIRRDDTPEVEKIRRLIDQARQELRPWHYSIRQVALIESNALSQKHRHPCHLRKLADDKLPNQGR